MQKSMHEKKMNRWHTFLALNVKKNEKNEVKQLIEGSKAWLKGLAAERGWGWGGGQSHGDKQDAGRWEIRVGSGGQSQEELTRAVAYSYQQTPKQ